MKVLFHVVEAEDGSVRLDAIRENKRLAIIFESDYRESSWHFVSKNEGEAMVCELFDKIAPKNLFDHLKKFIEE